MRFIVIGITDSTEPGFQPEVLDVIQHGRLFSGGRRHHEIVAPWLPAEAEWIDITVPLDAVFAQYHDEVIVFASGDPLFFGFANTIRRRMPEADIRLYPAFNSLQMLAHRLLLPYHDMRVVSLTGRPWQELDRALIERAGTIGILTDRERTPDAIARRMLEYGYSGYDMSVGEHLGNPSLERVRTLPLDEAARREFAHPNCVMVRANPCQQTCRTFGIPDTEFALLDGREKMITKMPVRLLTLQMLDLPKRQVLWDIGACTGSVSIEARLQFPHLRVEAFEVRPACESVIRENARRHGALGIGVHIGDFLSLDCDAIAADRRPDAVFIGGHGGQLREIMEKALRYLAPDGCIVMNSVRAPKVLTDSRQLWEEACRQLRLRQEPPLYIQIDEHHPITILKCKR